MASEMDDCEFTITVLPAAALIPDHMFTWSQENILVVFVIDNVFPGDTLIVDPAAILTMQPEKLKFETSITKFPFMQIVCEEYELDESVDALVKLLLLLPIVLAAVQVAHCE